MMAKTPEEIAMTEHTNGETQCQTAAVMATAIGQGSRANATATAANVAAMRSALCDVGRPLYDAIDGDAKGWGVGWADGVV